MSRPDQPSLFGSEPPSAPVLPDGFRYATDLISPPNESDLIRSVETLPLKKFEIQGYVGKWRVVSFGWQYDFNERAMREAEGIPAFLLPLRERVAAFAGRTPADFAHVLVTEYSAGAEIGWHKDKAVFDDVVGVSLGSPCRFRFRRQLADGKWQRANLTLEPRSVYLLIGPSRTEWEHSIPAVEQLRYSITFRTLRGNG